MGSCLKKSKQGKKRKCLAKKTTTEGFGATEKLPPSTKFFYRNASWHTIGSKTLALEKKTLNRENINSLVKFETATLW